jgi:predicted secreted protein
VQRAAKGLQDGDQGGEIEELMKLMNQLAGAVQVKGTKTEVSLANLAARIKQLENKP